MPKIHSVGEGSHTLSPAEWRHWYWKGARRVASIPAAILMVMFIGFSVLARETGLTLEQTLVTGIGMWAMPSQVLLISAIAIDASIITTIIVIALASVRFLPAVVSLIPVVRDKNTPLWQLLLVGQTSAVTGWVFAMSEAPKLPRPARVPFVLGFSLSLASLAGVGVVLTYNVISHLPGSLAGAFVFLTPVYFLCSLTGSSKALSDRLAMALGLVIGSVLLYMAPEFALLWTGLVGGTLAYMTGRILRQAERKEEK